MTTITHAIAAFFIQAFHGELSLIGSLSLPGKLAYGFYALAAVMVIRPHIRQAMRYRHGAAGKGDFCHRAQLEAIVWRLAPLCYAFVIHSKLLALSVLIDIAGRLWTIHESHQAEKRFMRGDGSPTRRQNKASMSDQQSMTPKSVTAE